MNEKREAIIWGAGKIGRGFLAEIFQSAGYQISFVEYDNDLAERLKTVTSYEIIKVLGEDRREKVEISGFYAYQSGNEEAVTEKILNSNAIIAVVVPKEALEGVAGALAKSLAVRARETLDSPLDIILCVNMDNPASAFREYLEDYLPEESRTYLEDKVGLVESVVMRITPETPPKVKSEDPLAIVNNGYGQMPVEKASFKGPVPRTDMLKLTNDIEGEKKKKTYILNTAHAMFAYLGSPRGYAEVDDCLRDPEVWRAVEGALRESEEGLIEEYGFRREEMNEWHEKAIDILKNPVALEDKLSRLGKDTRRKLGEKDRLVGPAKLALKGDIIPYYLAQGIAYGFKFNQTGDPGTKEVQNSVKNKGIEKTLSNISNLEEGILFTFVKGLFHQISESHKIYLHPQRRDSI